MNVDCTRRSMLVRAMKGLAGVCAAVVVAPLVGVACKRNQDQSQTFPVSNSEDVVTPCPDQDALTEQEINIRNSLKYVDNTPVKGRTCDNCKLYTLPIKSMCGGCKIVPGPIHPKGYCTAWLHRM